MALNCHPRIGSQTLKKILAIFPDPAVLWQSKNADTSILGEKISLYIREAVERYHPESVLEQLSKENIGYLTYYDKKYPMLLKEIPDHPVILYIKGSLSALNPESLAIVGSRKYSDYGHDVAKKVAGECANNGLTLVSGLALGIDTVVHRSTLDHGGLTVGVLACGLETVYPSSNTFLAKEIIEKGGAIISEYPPGTIPMKQNFPARNRIIAGLSLGTLVVEAAADSGALITAYQALEYNRLVFAIPGNIDSPNSAGPNMLIREGATLVTSANEIFTELNIKTRKAELNNRNAIPENENEIKISELLRASRLGADELVRLTGINVIELCSILTIMEMKGMISNSAGRYHLNS